MQRRKTLPLRSKTKPPRLSTHKNRRIAKKIKDLQDKYEDANHLAPNTVYIQIENLKKKLLAEDEQSVKDNEDKIKEELAEWAEENPAASEMRIKSQRLDIEDKYRKWAFVLRCFN